MKKLFVFLAANFICYSAQAFSCSCIHYYYWPAVDKMIQYENNVQCPSGEMYQLSCDGTSDSWRSYVYCSNIYTQETRSQESHLSGSYIEHRYSSCQLRP